MQKSIKYEIDKLPDHVLIVPEQNSNIIACHAGTTMGVAMLRKNVLFPGCRKVSGWFRQKILVLVAVLISSGSLLERR